MAIRKHSHPRSKPLTTDAVDHEPIDVAPVTPAAPPVLPQDIEEEIELEPIPAAPRPQPVATQPIPISHEPEDVPAAHEPEPIEVAPEPEPIEAAHDPEPIEVAHEPEPVEVSPDPEPITVADTPEPITAARSVDAPQRPAASQQEASPRIERPQTAPRIAAHIDSPVATDSTSAVKLFQTAHGRMVMLQRLDAQLSVVLEQRQKLQSELAALQDEINNEFDRVARSAEDTLATIMS